MTYYKSTDYRNIPPEIMAQIEASPDWFLEEIKDYPLTEWQYNAFVKGYNPDWECRYAPYLVGEWFYITRSCCWVKKFKYEKQHNGLYHITEHYSTNVEKGRDLLEEIFIMGYFKPAIWINYEAKIDHLPLELSQQLLKKAYACYGDFNVNRSYLNYTGRFNGSSYLFEVRYEQLEHEEAQECPKAEIIVVPEKGEAHWATPREMDEILFYKSNK